MGPLRLNDVRRDEFVISPPVANPFSMKTDQIDGSCIQMQRKLLQTTDLSETHRDD
jgi:hypothetical protein